MAKDTCQLGKKRSDTVFDSPGAQDPVAVIGLSCRLPGRNNSPTALWEFLKRGECARTEPPESRFNLKGHNDASKKPNTMRTPGGMFLENIDPRDIDAQFFRLSQVEAISMDPQQRQLLEVMYEGLENAGISLEELKGKSIGCFVSSYASDYGDSQSRDPEDKPPASTIGVGRAMLSNRISHFLDIHGPSMTIDTACSGGLVAVDVACHYLKTREIEAAIVSGCNLYLSPEHTMDQSMSGAVSITGRCHTFDAKADGYVKAEAVNSIIIKRLEDAVKNRDPIRAVISGSATNSNGRTAGIASPSSSVQSLAICRAYANAGISEFNSTSYLECHGTGTPVGDPVEVAGISSVFGATRSLDKPLIIGSIKSNIGHSEPAAGLSGLLKTILALENRVIPGNPTFEVANPEIDFLAQKVHASKEALPWPRAAFRRACVNSFGYGGSNAVVILDEAKKHIKEDTSHHISSYFSENDDIFVEEVSDRPHMLVFSANDEASLKAYCGAMNRHLIDPRVNIKLPDLAFTLSERRTIHFYRAYTVARITRIDESSLVYGKLSPNPPRVSFVFTGQGSQWPQMGKDLIDTFPDVKAFVEDLNSELQSLPDSPKWSLLEELIEPRKPEQFRLPEFSQPLITAIQLLILHIFNKWGIRPQSVLGHSSGEIAAATSAGFLTPKEAIKIAYYRGKAATLRRHEPVDATGMLAVGLGLEQLESYTFRSDVQVACINSASSITLSGRVVDLEEIRTHLQAEGHFARVLQVDLAYHSHFITDIATHYKDLLLRNCELRSPRSGEATMFSTVTARRLDGQVCDANYWEKNMVSPVLFKQAVEEMVLGQKGPDILVEIGPSGALAGPISQIKKELKGERSSIQYYPALKRGINAANALFDVAGRIFISGGHVSTSDVNGDQSNSGHPSTIVDLPNYAWNHSIKYWHESDSSKDWRFRRFVHHDLLGSKILGTSWHAPSWRKLIRVQDLPWLKDHKLGRDIVFPAAGYLAMAVEALYQTGVSVGKVDENSAVNDLCYRLRNVVFAKAMVLEDKADGSKVMLTLTRLQNAWHEFRISSSTEGVWTEHCKGCICIMKGFREDEPTTVLSPLRHSTPARLWYKAMQDVGYSFGPHFQKQLEVESTAGCRHNKTLLSFSEPPSAFSQSSYPMHPACIDGCLQAGGPSLWKGYRSSMNTMLIPASIDEMTINSHSGCSETGIAIASAAYSGIGPTELAKNYKSYTSVYDSKTESLLLQISGLAYHELEIHQQAKANHTYTCISWKPDISFITQSQLPIIIADEHNVQSTKSEKHPGVEVNRILDLVAHKKPNLKVLEVSMLENTDSLWLEGGLSSSSCRAFHLASHVPATLLGLHEKYGAYGNIEFRNLDLTKPSPDFAANEMDFNLVILQLTSVSKEDLKNVIQNSRRLLCSAGHIVLTFNTAISLESGLGSISTIVNEEESRNPVSVLEANDFHHIIEIPSGHQASEIVSSAFYAMVAWSDVDVLRYSDRCVDLVSISSGAESTHNTKETLTENGWHISEHRSPFNSVTSDGIILVLDELSSAVLTDIDGDQWQALQHLISLGKKILWVSTGSQFQVTQPHKALINGLARAIRAEDPSLVLATLDVESASHSRTPAAIHDILCSLRSPILKTSIESEFVERNGIIYTSRIIPDKAINKAEKNITHGADPQLMSLFEHKSCVRLVCQRPGNLDSLCFHEISAAELPLEDDFVEVDIHAAGLNFKDVATAMGIVPEDNRCLGLEGAGVIRRIGRRATSFVVGQRVLVHGRGCFANMVQTPVQGTHLLPDSMSFEEAARLPCVWLVVLYGLRDIHCTQPNERVLIHSAAGGVGIAAIQFCQYIGAEIYATVGTEEKRNFLVETFNIPAERIFSSRSMSFASELMSATNGKGVNVILNSLTGDLLDESWRCIADGGTLVEIGKTYIVERHSLSMEPFSRNASYRAVDMSHESISKATTARLLSDLFKLIREGHIKPTSPVKTFNFSEIPAAFRYMRQGNHIGKIIFSKRAHETVKVPIRPAIPVLSLRDDVAYVIVGGLRGLCGSLAVYMARLGARYLVIMSRSDLSLTDEKSQGILMDLEALNTQVELVQGDVSVVDDVRRMFQKSTKPIGGIIQGAMVLRDKIFTSMTVEDFHDATRAKVKGTWNLHNIALEQKAPIEFFTMLSSVSGVVGQKAQANYAAANTFLDSFAAYRLGLGLPASSVDLGVIEDTGYISEREELASRLDTTIWTGINERLLHEILRFSILQQTSPLNPASTAQMITGIPVPQNEDSFLLRDARFESLNFGPSKLHRPDGHNSFKDAHAFLALLKAKADWPTLLAGAIEIVNRKFVQSLNLSEPLEPAKPLSSYGLDSLAAVEIRNWIRMDLGAEITTLEINNASSLSALCEKIVKKLIPA